MSRCTHEHAHQSNFHDQWVFCPDCRGYFKKREMDGGVGDGR